MWDSISASPTPHYQRQQLHLCLHNPSGVMKTKTKKWLTLELRLNNKVFFSMFAGT